MIFSTAGWAFATVTFVNAALAITGVTTGPLDNVYHAVLPSLLVLSWGLLGNHVLPIVPVKYSYFLLIVRLLAHRSHRMAEHNCRSSVFNCNHCALYMSICNAKNIELPGICIY
jgi:hypothetical protein